MQQKRFLHSKSSSKKWDNKFPQTPQIYSSWSLSAKYISPPLMQTLLATKPPAVQKQQKYPTLLTKWHRIQQIMQVFVERQYRNMCNWSQTKKKTGSVFLIRWINKFGHTICYCEVNCVETKLAKVQANHIEPREFVPNNFQPSTFVTLHKILIYNIIIQL